MKPADFYGLAVSPGIAGIFRQQFIYRKEIMRIEHQSFRPDAKTLKADDYGCSDIVP